MWDYKNVTNIRRSLFSVNWKWALRQKNIYNQIAFLTNNIENAFSNFCPHRIIECRFKDAPWMTNEIKQKGKDKFLKPVILWLVQKKVIIKMRGKGY